MAMFILRNSLIAKAELVDNRNWTEEIELIAARMVHVLIGNEWSVLEKPNRLSD